ncbi:hypothetical protein NQ176_g1655 [Zarea fungicola]|uniref:Uncharacterized protein n=1 Tax=Zarea fungicola TaxID=93591 RepID=A0ACC1NRS0_9HYPO|nr:hypothetical protein NQ176_g1655 [Lecanicillium fungicola]
MAFPFGFLCKLLERLEKIPGGSSDTVIITAWFNEHSSVIPRQGPAAITFLSCLFPEQRPDRVFGLQERQLESIIQHAQCLGPSRVQQLQSLKASGHLDFAASVERVMAITDCEPRIGSEPALEEIDDTLDQVAAISRFSSASLRDAVIAKHGRLHTANKLLSQLFSRLKSSEAKWMIRMMFKSYSPAHIPSTLAMSKFHFLLPDLMRLQASIPAAVEVLGAPIIQHMPTQPPMESYSELRKIALRGVVPRVGVMVARNNYEKARSIKHCCQVAGSRQMSVERKYDGEYCQVHIKLEASGANIQIFSKSGRDSTRDRAGIHQAVRDSLRLDMTGCRITKQCILEGELVES